MPINMQVEYPKLKRELSQLRCEYDILKEHNKALSNALKNLCKVAARETATLIAWDGANKLDKAIDKGLKVIKQDSIIS